MERLRDAISQPRIRSPRRSPVNSSAPAAFRSFSSTTTSIAGLSQRFDRFPVLSSYLCMTSQFARCFLFGCAFGILVARLDKNVTVLFGSDNKSLW